jgi:hypothetical protein
MIERDARWRAAVERLLDVYPIGSTQTMRLGLERIVDEPDARLTEDGIAARDAYREVCRLLKGA